MKRPYSSEVCSRRLVRRQEATQAPRRRGRRRRYWYCRPQAAGAPAISPEATRRTVPVLRAHEERARLVQVHRHPLAPVRGADALPQRHAVASPRRVKGAVAPGEELAVARVERAQQGLEQARAVVDAAGEQAQRRRAGGHLRRKGLLVHVEPDAQDRRARGGRRRWWRPRRGRRRSSAPPRARRWASGCPAPARSPAATASTTARAPTRVSWGARAGATAGRRSTERSRLSPARSHQARPSRPRPAR